MRQLIPVVTLFLALLLVPASVHGLPIPTPVLGDWVYLGEMPTGRVFLAAAGVDGYVYTFGGYGVTGNADWYGNMVEVYIPAYNAWTAGADLPGPGRCGLAVTVGKDGRIYAIAGLTRTAASPPTWPFQYLDRVDVFDPSTNQWTTAHSLPSGRFDLAAATAQDGRIYVFGGTDDGNLSAAGRHALSLVEMYDPLTDKWTRKANMPIPSYGLSAVTGRDGRIYVMGGSTTNTGWYPTTRLDIYDPRTDTWSPGVDLPRPRVFQGATLGVDGRIYVAGGGDRSDYPTVDAYDPISDTWSSKANMHVGRSGLALAEVDGRIYAMGGEMPGGITKATEVYLPVIRYLLPFLANGG